MLWGEAGTGKSHTLNAARAAYEAEGSKVIGLAWTNDVVQQMRGDGFTANTIASELDGLQKGRTAWNKNTVLIVDEAAMVATEHLSRPYLRRPTGRREAHSCRRRRAACQHRTRRHVRNLAPDATARRF